MYKKRVNHIVVVSELHRKVVKGKKRSVRVI